jgi:hypothetical protein
VKRAAPSTSTLTAARRRMLRAAQLYDQAERELEAARRGLVRAGVKRPRGGVERWPLAYWLLESVTSILQDGVGTDEHPGDLLRADAMPGGIERHVLATIEQERRERRERLLRAA